MVSIEVSMPRATWTSDLPSISSVGRYNFDRYMTFKCDRYMTVTAFDPPQVAAPPSRSDL